MMGVVLLAVCGGRLSAEPPLARPFESSAAFTPVNTIDSLVLASLKKQRIEPAHLCSDEVFVRRVYLDVIGTLPEAEAVEAFRRDQRPDKRARLIDALLEGEEFADYQAMKWCDLLRVKSEFPINLWPNAVQAYHRWIHDAIRDNLPYDAFCRELLTSSGSNFRVPQVNFYRAIQGREPASIAEAVALTFMGTRLSGWPEARRAQMAVFFSRIAYKQTAEWKEEIICLSPEPAGPVEAMLPDGAAVRIPPDKDPRQVFADWLITPRNPWFARTAVNRVWAWLLGRGIVHEPDDIRLDNPPVNPALLAYLEKELVASRYDLRHVYRLILNSRVYQQSSIPRSEHEQVEALFACYPVRRLEAEVLIDAINQLFGGAESYSSPIPEPFTFIPEHQRTINLADASISSSFLELFGRPARDTGLASERNNQSTEAQRLHLINSTHIQRKIQGTPRLRALSEMARRRPEQMIRALYLNILSRDPTPEEVSIAQAYLRSVRSPREAAEDLAWALVNSKEFLYRH